MESNNGYSITTGLVKIGGGTCVFSEGQTISENEKQLICQIHNAVNGHYVSCGARELLQKMFDDNIFFVCLESGAVMLSFIQENDSVGAEGIFICKNDLKTAWKLYMPYLVYMFISGRAPDSTAVLDFFEFKEYSVKLKDSLPADKLVYADAIIRKLRARAVPFSFYSARLPSSMIPGGFENITPDNVNISPVNINSGIVFDNENVMRAALAIKNKNPELIDIRFCKTTPKRYRELRKAEIKEHCMKQNRRKMLKNIEKFDSSIKNIWFFSYKDEYYISVSDDIARRIEKSGGMIPFNILYEQMSCVIPTVTDRIISYQTGVSKAPKVVVLDSFEETMEKINQHNSNGILEPFGTSGSMPSVSCKGNTVPSKQRNQSQKVPRPAEMISPAEKEKRKGIGGLFKKDSK